MRLDKYLAKSLGISRSDAIQQIKNKLVMVNGHIILQKDYVIDIQNDKVFYQGTQIHYLDKIYIMMNKPASFVSATKDEIHKTVFDLIEGFPKQDLFIVGRLDIDVTGLLLITNDGKLSHQFTNPKHHIVKRYLAKLSQSLSDSQIKEFEKGIQIKDGFGELYITKPAKLTIDEVDQTLVCVEISEGKYHQVKRMFAYFGVHVVALRRIQIGQLKLDETLKEGEYRLLTEDEIKQLIS